MIETVAPVKKATYRATIIDGNPNKKPKANDNLTSPNPIPRPFVTTKSTRKNINAPSPAYRWFVIDACFSNKKALLAIVDIIISRSGIIPYCISAKKIPIKLHKIIAKNIADIKLIDWLITRAVKHAKVIPERTSTTINL